MNGDGSRKRAESAWGTLVQRWRDDLRHRLAKTRDANWFVRAQDLLQERLSSALKPLVFNLLLCSSAMAEELDSKFSVPSAGEVSSTLLLPTDAQWLLVLGHGAGAGMRHPFMTALSRELAAEKIATFLLSIPLHGESPEGARLSANADRDGLPPRRVLVTQLCPSYHCLPAENRWVGV